MIISENCTLIRTLNTGHTKTHDIDFSNDGTLMLTCGDDRTFKVWNISGINLATTAPPMIGGGFSTGVSLMVCKFSMSNIILTGNTNNDDHKVYPSNFTNTVIRIYNIPTGGKAYSAGFFYCENTTKIVMGSDSGKIYWYNGTSTASTITQTLITDLGAGFVWFAKVDKTNQFMAYGG